MPSHSMIKILLEDDLCIFIFGLKITTCNGHDTLICSIVNMTSHGGPIDNTFNMIKHDPCMLKISARLHPSNLAHSTTRAYLRHFEYEYLVKVIALTQKHIPIGVSLIDEAVRLGNAVHNAKRP